LDFFH